MSLDERIRVAACDYLGWSYRPSGSPARVARAGAPWVPDAVVREAAEPTATDCCTFVSGVLSVACPGRWPADAWPQMMILDGTRPWSTVDCPIAAGVAVAADSPLGWGWYVVQGWSGLRLGRVEPGATGHTWLQYGTSTILEASSSARTVRWAERPWADTLRRYGAVRLALLLEAS